MIALDSQFKTNNFDLLRIFAATQVLFGHTVLHLGIAHPVWWPIVEAFPGVPIFFVISGFLISASLERSRGLRSYARNRILRIYPGLWCCIFVTVLVATSFGFSFTSPSALIWLVSQLIGGIYTPHFLKDFGFGSYNGSLWTIPIELQFYIVLPILYWLIRDAMNQTGRCVVVWAVFVGIAFAASMFFSPLAELNQEPLLQKLFRYSFMPHIYLFLTGVLLQRLQVQHNRWIRGQGIYWMLGYLAFHFLVPYSAGSYVLQMMLLGVASVAVAYTAPTLSRRLLRGNDVSYGVYIYHGLLINVFIEVGLKGRPLYLIALACCTYAMAYLSWIVIEKPSLRSKKSPALAVDFRSAG